MNIRLGFIWEAARIAIESVLAHKLRTVLTLLGIIIGVASVMIVGAGIEGLETYVNESVSKTLGSNSFVLSQFQRLGHVSEEEWEKMLRRNKRIQLEDLDFLLPRCSDCQELAAEISTVQTVRSGAEEVYNVQISGVTANMIFLGSQEILEGRYLTSHEVRRSSYVCVIGWDLKEKFFPTRDPLGQYVKVQDKPLQVVGVMEKRGSVFGTSLDAALYMPVTTYQKIYGTRRSIQLRGTSASRETFYSALDQVRMAMRVRHHLKPNEEDDFGLVTTEEINTQVDQFTSAIAVVVIPITAISLLVGGIVVMNIMLVSVTERTFEVGLRKSLGARRRDILNQFLIESFILAALGGLIGLGLASLIAEVIEQTTPMRMTISWFYICLSIGVSGGIGIIFGIYPAYKAARLDPIVALREER